MAQRQVYVRWLSGNGLTLELHIPVSPTQPNANQSAWSEDHKRQIAQAATDAAIRSIETIETDGLK